MTETFQSGAGIQNLEARIQKKQKALLGYG